MPPSSTASPPIAPIPARLATFARDIKISHTIFAMPWAILAAFLAADGLPASGSLALILICMIAARTVAMAANRLLDAELDARNPRTARRAIPSGRLSRGFVAMILALCCIAFITATAGFWFLDRNPWPIALAIPVLLFLCGYPLMKRFTRLCHYYLGAALALAPVCAWLAIAGSIDFPPLLMAAAVLTWTAGFDIIYACQDYASDMETGVFSIPAAMGIAPALWISRLTHALCASMLILLGMASPALGMVYFIGVAIAIALLVVEQSLVRPNDLSRVGLSFFTINGVISVLVGTLGILDIYV